MLVPGSPEKDQSGSGDNDYRYYDIHSLHSNYAAQSEPENARIRICGSDSPTLKRAKRMLDEPLLMARTERIDFVLKANPP